MFFQVETHGIGGVGLGRRLGRPMCDLAEGDLEVTLLSDGGNSQADVGRNM